MDVAQLGAYLRQHFTDHPEPAGRRMFRLETLDTYEVASDGSDFARYLAGEEAPTPERKKPWEDRLRREFARGLRRSRVHVVESRPGELLPAYLEYECAWSYTRNGELGEDIRILDLAEVHLTAEERDLFVASGDFWLITAPGDEARTVRMDYDNAGQFVGAEAIEDDQTVYLRAAETAWGYAEPFPTWWARHQQDRRRAA
jgi:hypothetical protein